MGQDDGVDPVVDQALLEVLDPGQRGERLLQVGVGVAEGVQPPAHLGRHRALQGQAPLPRRVPEQQVVQGQQPPSSSTGRA